MPALPARASHLVQHRRRRRFDVLPLEQREANPLRLGGDRQGQLLAQPADLLAVLVAHQVGGTASLVADLAVGRDLEAFLHPLVGFQLGHVGSFLSRSGDAMAAARYNV